LIHQLILGGVILKTIVINASHRKDGATAKVLNEFVSHLKDGNAEISMFHLSDLDINFCTGCCGCYKTGHCFLDDDTEKLSQEIAKADSIIIGTPCYASGMSGQLKTVIDRGHFVIEQLLKGKHAIGVVTFENAGGASVWKSLKNLFVFSGASTVDKLVVKTPFNSDPLGNPNIKNKIKKKSIKLLKAVRNNKTSFMCRLTNLFVLNFGIKPFVSKKGEAYQGVLKHWKERGISHKTT